MDIASIEKIIAIIGAAAVAVAAIIKIPEMVVTLSENKKKVNWNERKN